MSLDEKWDQFLAGEEEEEERLPEMLSVPEPSTLYISTNTIISYFTGPIPLISTFWRIPIVPYSTPMVGVIKKQLKFNSASEEGKEAIMEQLSAYADTNVHIIHHSEVKGYRDARKISIGICKKDILSKRAKAKNAFYNCFVLILRVLVDDEFREFHVKVFLTGKIEIPGIQVASHLDKITELLTEVLTSIHPQLKYSKHSEQTVLINSNFTCGFYVHRNKLHDLLKYKYRISTVFDPCSYPGIQCKIYYGTEVTPVKQAIGISFMIFRTGSVLIVGKCPEHVIHEVYAYLSRLLKEEYVHIVDTHCTGSKKVKKSKVKKQKLSIR